MSDGYLAKNDLASTGRYHPTRSAPPLFAKHMAAFAVGNCTAAKLEWRIAARQPVIMLTVDAT